MVEHDLAVAGHPHVALEAGRAEPEGQQKRFEGVFHRVGPCASVGEADRRRTAGGESCRHGDSSSSTGQVLADAGRLSHVDQHEEYDGLHKGQGTTGSSGKGPIDSLKRIFSHADACGTKREEEVPDGYDPCKLPDVR